MMDPIDDYGVLQLTVVGCMKDLEDLYMMDPIDEYRIQQRMGLEISEIYDRVMTDCFGK